MATCSDIVRDVADMQLKAGEYVTELQETQSDLQAAIEQHDQQQLQHAAGSFTATAHRLQITP